MKKLTLPLVLCVLTFSMVALADDPATTPVADALPVTGVPWVDAVAKVLGFAFIVLTLLANTLPKALAVTQALAKVVSDFRGIVPAAAAKAEAVAQAEGQTTVPPHEQQVPLKAAARPPMFPKSMPPPRGFVELRVLAIVGLCLGGSIIAIASSCTPGAKQDAKNVVDVIRVLCPDFSCIEPLLASPKVDADTKTRLMAARAEHRNDAGK